LDRRIYAPLRELERTHWWFRGRRRILLAALERAGVQARSVLDVGCGSGANLELLGERFRGAALHGVDVEREPLRSCVADRRLSVSQADATRLPFASASFDLVTALDALEHFADDAGALRELHRVCRPGGALLVTVPAFRWLWGSVDDLGHHHRRYRRRELVERLAAAGFDVQLDRFFNFWLFPGVAAVRLLSRPRSRGGAAAAGDAGPVASDFDWGKGGPLGALLERILASEARMLAVRMPFGVSLLCVGRRRC
jgi:SAM-dependent methyltransferase